jgi:hypothetical protein
MAWTVGVIAAVLVTACAPEVLPVDAAPRAAIGAPNPPVSDVCGTSSGTVAPGALLSVSDVWPQAGDATSIASDTPLDGVACRKAVMTNVAPQAVSCGDGFPFVAAPALPVALATLGVTDIREADLVRVGASRSTFAHVSEYVLALNGPAAAGLEALAMQCDAVQTGDVQPPVYTIRDTAGHITVAVRTGYDLAVGLSFAGDELNDATKLALLDRAVDLAERAQSG